MFSFELSLKVKHLTYTCSNESNHSNTTMVSTLSRTTGGEATAGLVNLREFGVRQRKRPIKGGLL